jgi:hypothetical protein
MHFVTAQFGNPEISRTDVEMPVSKCPFHGR